MYYWVRFFLFSISFILGFSGVHVQSQSKSIILGRPTDHAITANILFDKNGSHFLEYGREPGVYPFRTMTISNKANIPDQVEIKDLEANTRYYYRMQYKPSGSSTFSSTPEYQFQTQRPAGSSFRFVIEADEHLYDKKGVRNLYKITLQNELSDQPDFMISLGDTFGDDHTPDQTTSMDMDALHKDYLQYLGDICHSVPFFFCLGNHEGENGYYLKQTPPDNIAVYGTLWRKYYYPNPEPNGFYSGNDQSEAYGMDLPQNYYAWTWGDALFVVLDVYRHCDVNEKPQNWDWTLGEKQYNWLKQTLERSTSKFKFVFAHHTRGQGRGGINTASGFEWGGYSSKNNWGFDQNRPGWDLPIHQLMVKNGVNIFFQGHDHLYAMEELDGMVYQTVPMPSDSTYEIGVLANKDAFSGLVLDGSGHILVTVDPDEVKVDYIQSYLPKDTVGGLRKNKSLAHRYTIHKSTSSLKEGVFDEKRIKVFPNPTHEMLSVDFSEFEEEVRSIDLVNLNGQKLISKEINTNGSRTQIGIGQYPPGVYCLKVQGPYSLLGTKLIVIE